MHPYSEGQTTLPSRHLAHFPTPCHAVDYIMETFPIVKRRDEQEFGEYRAKRRILEIYDALSSRLASPDSPLPADFTLFDPPPGPPCDAEGAFISVEDWDKDDWPINIHKLS